VADPRLFDLNIEEVLEHWEVEHAIREVIANALDEQFLTGSAEVEISEDGAGGCRVRDFGRGLSIEHFTLSENAEKLAAPEGVIGKFGVGLKDALATFHRRGVGVTIVSAHGTFALREAHKHNFEGITTLHVERSAGVEGMAGTEVILDGVESEDVAKAKALFLRFSTETTLERTAYGEVLRKGPWDARVYITGVLANEESNFLFSYNITSLTEGMKKRLNRERLNVGRTTYAERVKAILRSAESAIVTDALADQVAQRAKGSQCDEMQWIEISQRALNLLHARAEVTYLTEEEMRLHPDVVDNMRRDGYEVVAVDDAQKAKLEAQVEEGDELRTLEGYIEQYNDSFRYEFVPVETLTPPERAVFEQTPTLLGLVGIDAADFPPVRISETMRVGLDSTQGVWDTELREIVIKRDQLASVEAYGGTLLHEAAHATTDAVDATRFFESVLTRYLGSAAAAALQPDLSDALEREKRRRGLNSAGRVERVDRS
jgi:hypothetical protein